MEQPLEEQRFERILRESDLAQLEARLTEAAEREVQRILSAAREESRRLIEETRRQASEVRVAAERDAVGLKRSSALESAQLYAEAEKRAAEVLVAARRVGEAMSIIEGTGEAKLVQNEQAGSVALEGMSLDSLLKELRRLTLKNTELEAALELAHRKVTVYESFDDSIRDAMSYSLRIAFEIKEKSEREARELVDHARSEALLLKEEIARLSTDRDSLVAERDALVGSIEALRAEMERDASRRSGQKGEETQLLSEVATLERRLREIRDDLESLSGGGQVKRMREPAQSVREVLEPERIIHYPTAPTKPEPVPQFPPLQIKPDQAVRPEAEPASTTVFPVSAEEPVKTVRDQFEPAPAPREDSDGLREFLKVVPTPVADVSTDPLASTSTVQAERLPERMDRPSSLATGPAVQSASEVELVVSPVHSFPKLVELERALQTLPEVKSFYVRDFRYGVATLLIRLTRPEAREDLPAKLEGMPGWNMTILSSPPHRIEAKIGA